MRDADGNVTHYVINDTGTGTSGRMVPADQYHQSLDPGPAAVTDAPIRTPAAAREAAPTVENALASPEGTTVPRDAASRGDPATEEDDPASEEQIPDQARPAEDPQSAENAHPGDTPEAKASGNDAKAAGDGDSTVQTGDRAGGLENGEGDTATRGANSERYGDLKTKLPADEQAHHLNQNAAFSRDDAGNPVIPKEEGASTGLKGNAFKDSGTAHYEAHKSLETFWNQYRKGGALEGTTPTNAEYDQALRASLKSGGLSDQDVNDLAKAAEKNRLDYGLNPTDEVPRIPGRINQTSPPPAPPTSP